MNNFKDLLPQWHKEKPATLKMVQLLEKSLRVALPSDFKEFVMWSNGGEGFLGKQYLCVWSVQEILPLNKDYQVANYLPGIVGIGTDGGDQLYAIDYREASLDPCFISVPLGDLAAETIVRLSRSFLEWLIQNARH